MMTISNNQDKEYGILYRTRFFQRHHGSRRGGSGADVGRGPLWPPVVGIKNVLLLHPQPSALRAATRAPTPPNTTPAPMRTIPLFKTPHRKPTPARYGVPGGGKPYPYILILGMLLMVGVMVVFSPVPVHADGGAPNLAYVVGTAKGISTIDIGQQK